MKRNTVFQIRNQVKRAPVWPAVGGAALLVALVLVFAVARSAPDQSIREEGVPLGAGPTAEKVESEARPPSESEPWFADPDELLTVVDRTTALPRDFVPSGLVSLKESGVPCQPETWKARRVIIADLKELFAAGRREGHEFFVFSAYRSYDTQAGLFQYWVKTLGEKEADRSSARAGHSEHQLGTTLDISVRGLQGNVYDVFGASAAGRWLAAQAWRFGFVMSYPEGEEEASGYQYEPWHYRYVGREAAALIASQRAVPPVFIRELARQRRGEAAPKIP